MLQKFRLVISQSQNSEAVTHEGASQLLINTAAINKAQFSTVNVGFCVNSAFRLEDECDRRKMIYSKFTYWSFFWLIS